MEAWVIHAIELRKRLIRALIGFGISFGLCILFANSLYTYVVSSFLWPVTYKATLIATHVTTPFTTPIQLSFYLALFISLPWILLQIWGFIQPALYPEEQHTLRKYLLFSIGAFYTGAFLAWAFVCPIALSFFHGTAPGNVQWMPEMEAYLDFILDLMLGFGFAFQLPLILHILLEKGYVKVAQLVAARRYMMVFAFVLGMLLTPPDVLSQVLMAVPLILLYEGFIWHHRKKERVSNLAQTL